MDKSDKEVFIDWLKRCGIPYRLDEDGDILVYDSDVIFIFESDGKYVGMAGVRVHD